MGNKNRNTTKVQQEQPTVEQEQSAVETVETPDVDQTSPAQNTTSEDAVEPSEEVLEQTDVDAETPVEDDTSPADAPAEDAVEGDDDPVPNALENASDEVLEQVEEIIDAVESGDLSKAGVSLQGAVEDSPEQPEVDKDESDDVTDPSQTTETPETPEVVQTEGQDNPHNATEEDIDLVEEQTGPSEEPVPAVIPLSPLAVARRELDNAAVNISSQRAEIHRLVINDGVQEKAEKTDLLRKLLTTQTENVDRWSDYDVLRWGRTGQLPEATKEGLYPNDVKRSQLDVSKWSDLELRSLVLGSIKSTSLVDRNSAASELVRRHSLDPLLSFDQVRVWVETGKVVELTYEMTDLFRLKPAPYWSDEELSLFFQGKLKETTVVKNDDVYNEYRRRHDLSKTSYPDSRIQGLMGKPENGVKKHMALTFLTAELKAYAEKMAPAKAISESDAGAMQSSLYRQMVRVMNLEGQDFVTGWTEILDFFHIHASSHFNEKSALRGLGFFTGSSRDRATFEQLVNLCVRTADPKVRYTASKNLNFGAVLENVKDEKIRHRMLGYYRVGQ